MQGGRKGAQVLMIEAAPRGQFAARGEFGEIREIVPIGRHGMGAQTPFEREVRQRIDRSMRARANPWTERQRINA